MCYPLINLLVSGPSDFTCSSLAGHPSIDCPPGYKCCNTKEENGQWTGSCITPGRFCYWCHGLHGKADECPGDYTGLPHQPKTEKPTTMSAVAVPCTTMITTTERLTKKSIKPKPTKTLTKSTKQPV